MRPSPPVASTVTGGKIAVNGALSPVEHVRAVAGDRLVGGQRIARVVREGDQVNGGGIGDDGDIGAAAQRGNQPGDDGLPGAVAHVQDAPARVGGLLPHNNRAVRLAVEGDAGRFDQDFLQQRRPFFGQDARRLR